MNMVWFHIDSISQLNSQNLFKTFLLRCFIQQTHTIPGVSNSRPATAFWTARDAFWESSND